MSTLQVTEIDQRSDVDCWLEAIKVSSNVPAKVEMTFLLSS